MEKEQKTDEKLKNIKERAEEENHWRDTIRQTTKFIGEFEKLDEKDFEEIPIFLKVLEKPDFKLSDLKKCQGIVIKTIKGVVNNKCKLINTKDKEQRIKELTDTLQRLQAEFENYKKRAEKQGEELGKYLKADLIARLLPTLDSFEMALKNTSDKEKFIKGVELIFAQLYSLLESEGIRPIKAVGEQFDPYRHEVLMKQESDKEEDIILEELQKGYMLNDKVLRHSKVKVSKKVHKK